MHLLLSWWMSSAMVVEQNALCSRSPAPTVAELRSVGFGLIMCRVDIPDLSGHVMRFAVVDM